MIDSGAQPLTSQDESLILSVNGEIYNHKELKKTLRKGTTFRTHSDSEVILPLYEEHDIGCANLLDGMFSFALFDVKKNRLIAARDPIGITTLYQGFSSKMPGTVYFASELKSLHEECDKIVAFPPGHIYDSATGKTTRYYNPSWWDANKIPTSPVDYTTLREALEAAVRKRLMSEVPYGVLLSGGLDSSLIASIAARETDRVAKAQREQHAMNLAIKNGAGIEAHNGTNGDIEDADRAALAVWPRLHSFSIGLPGAPDLVAARDVAKFLDTVHHECTFTVQEGIDAIPDVIYHLETYDVTTVRASTPMYLLSRKIKANGVKMVLSGEGSDEILGGYLYFHAAPTPKDFHQECVGRVKNLHFADCLRANKSTMAWGLEARVPFLDKQFLEVAMNIDPKEKMFTAGGEKMEKYILRKAFDLIPEGDDKPYLPANVLWRQKEQFSDGVGYSWIDSVKGHAEALISDELFAQRAANFPYHTPDTKEAYWFRQVFETAFPGDAPRSTVERWIPKAEWGCNSDPSGRAQKVHTQAYKK